MGLTQVDEEARGGDQVALPDLQVPVDPGEHRVLAVAVVVSLLGAAHLVTGQQHGRPGAQQNGGQQVAHGTTTQHLDRPAVDALDDVALEAVVPGAVVGGAIAVVLLVGQIVLVVVDHQVTQGEAVVRRHEVDRAQRTAPAGELSVAEQVRAARQACGQVAQVRAQAPLGDLRGVVQPEGARGVAEVVVPVLEGLGELAGAPASGAHVPRLTDELDRTEHRIGGDRREQRVARRELRGMAPQRGRQVEAEAVHSHLGDPVAQRVQDHPDRTRGPEVHRVAGAGDIHVLGRQVGGVQVVVQVIQAAQAQGGAVDTALAGVVVDDVEHDLQAGLVKHGDHAAYLVQDRLRAGRARRGRGVGGLGREVAQRGVAPVVGQLPLGQEGLGHRGVDRQQLDCGDPQSLEVLDRHRVGQSRVGAAQLLGHAGQLVGQALDVGLVDDGALAGDARPRNHREGVTGDHADDGAARRVQVRGAPGLGRRDQFAGDLVSVDRRHQVHLSVQGAGIGVQQQLAGVVEQPLMRVPGAVSAVAVALPSTDAGNVRAPDAALRTVHPDPGLLRHGAVVGHGQQAQVHRRGMRSVDGEVRTVTAEGNAQSVGGSCWQLSARCWSGLWRRRHGSIVLALAGPDHLRGSEVSLVRVRRVAFMRRGATSSSSSRHSVVTLTLCQGDSALSGEMLLLWQP